MVFSSLVFLFLFLPICILLYFLAPGLKFKNIILLICSLFFYAWGEPVWVCLLLISGLVDYINGRIIGRYRGRLGSKLALLCSLIVNLSLLGVFKYSNFFIENINAVLSLEIPYLQVTLPIGISFYTFQTISYTIDVYRNKVHVQKSFIDFQLFVSLFPQLIAGPILRYSDLEKQLKKRTINFEKFSGGINRFLCGLAKKVLIANYVGEVATSILDSSLSGLPVINAWLGILMFAFQIYFDFSGYSDMAIGLGKMFGFSYPENFNYPYVSKSITDFWRRWHISLGSFFRDYVYIPLGGNRKYQFRNILVVWFLTGFWHGASWNFILWGLYFAILLILEKYVLLSILNKVPGFLRLGYSFFFVLIGWVLFYFTDLSRGIQLLGIMFGFSESPFYNGITFYLISSKYLLVILAVIASTPIIKSFKQYIEKLNILHIDPAMKSLNIIVNMGLLYFCVVSLIGQSFNPFLYFRF